MEISTCLFDGDKPYEPLFRVVPPAEAGENVPVMVWSNKCTPLNEKESLRISILKWRAAYFFVTQGGYTNIYFGASSTCACCTYADYMGEKEGRDPDELTCDFCPIGKSLPSDLDDLVGCEATPWNDVKSSEPDTVLLELDYLENIWHKLYGENLEGRIIYLP